MKSCRSPFLIRWTAVLGLLLCAGQANCQQPNIQYAVQEAGCVQCHSQKLIQEDFVQTLPATIWSADDKHKNAFYLLHETDPADPQKGAAKRELVSRILGFNLADAFAQPPDGATSPQYFRLKSEQDADTVRKVSTVKLCLRCHATWPKEQEVMGRYALAPPVPLSLGVSCQACHGPGQKWDPLHRSVAWRAITPEAKEKLGFLDCRSTVGKARLCASCHVGSAEQDKFVTHDWYAKGHPPLPSFELASFADQMPRHWTGLNEKKAFKFRDGPPRDDDGSISNGLAQLKGEGVPDAAIKSSYLEANFPGAVAKGLDPYKDLPRLKDVTVSGVIVLETYARTLGAHALRVEGNKMSRPELALYDCTACHHELRSGLGTNTRPRRSHTPGRPPLATWSRALIQLAAAQAAGHDPVALKKQWSELQDEIKNLESAVTSRPFGDPAKMKTAANGLVDSLTQLATDVSNTRFDGQAAKKAMELLASMQAFETNDFYSARQVAWALREIAKDRNVGDANRLFASGNADPLALRLPSGPGHSVMLYLRDWLPAASHYDAVWFREQLETTKKAE